MVRDAERFKDEDDKQRERLQAKNGLEGYAFSIKSTLDDDKLKDKISAEDRQKVQEKCEKVIRWIDTNQVWIRDRAGESYYSFMKICVTIEPDLNLCQLNNDCLML